MARRLLPALAMLAALAACTEETGPQTTPDDYVRALGAVCTATAAELDGLEQPADDAGVRRFASEVAALLRGEADAARALDVPDDLEDDHRTFVLTTDDQASRWEALAETPAGDAAFGDLTREIGELTLGRNDLVVTMGVDACRRSTAA